MIVAMDHWIGESVGTPVHDGARARLARLSEQIRDVPYDEEGVGPDIGPPHLSSIDFVQLWPKVIRELRDSGGPRPSTGSSDPSTPNP
jgi:hypothetical protein